MVYVMYTPRAMVLWRTGAAIQTWIVERAAGYVIASAVVVVAVGAVFIVDILIIVGGGGRRG